MSTDLNRLLRPRSIAVLGGSWARSVLKQCRRAGFQGEIWPLHPREQTLEGYRCYRDLDELPGVPDATFIGVNRHETVRVVERLSSLGAGGAVCFASGFSESSAEDQQGEALEHSLAAAAGNMPILGPNCYGFINYLDNALLWPDQHGGDVVTSGVALLCQSSNMAINLSMQTRGLPIAYILTAGNQLQQSLGALGQAVLQDSRVTALGLYVEGYPELRAIEALAKTARDLGKGIVILKGGRSAAARQAMVSHTNSLSGSDAAAGEFLRRLGIARVHGLGGLLESLKLLHVIGPLPNRLLQSMSCSGGEAALIADALVDHDLEFEPLTQARHRRLREVLGPQVALANPLDYHTYIWGDAEAMRRTYEAMMLGSDGLSLLIMDLPRQDRCDPAHWMVAVEAFVEAKRHADVRAGLLITLPENVPESLIKRLHEQGVVVLQGLEDAIIAIETAASIHAGRAASPEPLWLPPPATGQTEIWTEHRAKALLADYGVAVPQRVLAWTAAELLDQVNRGQLAYPLVLKAQGAAHKSEIGAVVTDVASEARLLDEAHRLESLGNGLMAEQQIDNAVAELLVSVVRDPVHGFMLTLAAGGVMTELWQDAVQLLLPCRAADVEQRLMTLRCASLLKGFRGRPACDLGAVVDSVMRLQRLVQDHRASLHEFEINPLLCTAHGAWAVDALAKVQA